MLSSCRRTRTRTEECKTLKFVLQQMRTALMALTSYEANDIVANSRKNPLPPPSPFPPLSSPSTHDFFRIFIFHFNWFFFNFICFLEWKKKKTKKKIRFMFTFRIFSNKNELFCGLCVVGVCVIRVCGCGMCVVGLWLGCVLSGVKLKIQNFSKKSSTYQ